MMIIATRVVLALGSGLLAVSFLGAYPSPLAAQDTKAAQPGQKPSGQGGSQGQQGQSGQGPQASAEERQLYQAISTELNAGLDPDKVISLSQDFEKKFPSSAFLSYVYAFEATGYQQKGDLPKSVEAGEKSIKLNGDNLMTLIILSSMLPQPQLMSGGDLDKQKKLAEAEADANHALEIIEKMPKQQNETDDALKKRKDTFSSGPHSALGMIHLQRATMGLSGMDQDELTKAAQEYKKSVDLHPAPEDYYRLGEVYEHQNKIDDALAAFSKASELGQGSGIQQFADTKIEELKKRQWQAKPGAH